MSGKVFVIGNFGIDVSVRASQSFSHPAGTALRCSLGASLFGLSVTPVAVAGSEPEFDHVLSCLKRRGVDLRFIKRSERSLRFVTTYDEDFRITSFRIENEHLIDELVAYADQVELQGAEYVVICPLPLTAIRRLATRASVAGITSILIIHYSMFSECKPEDLRNALTEIDFVILNKDEGASITGLTETIEIGRKLSQIARRGAFLTLHEEGACFFGRSGEFLHLPSLATEVRNVLGAGDAFAGGVIAGLHFTTKGELALTFGLLSAMLVVSQANHELLLEAMGCTQTKRA